MVNGSRYSKMDQVKFVEDSLQKIWSDMAYYHFKFLKAVFHRFYLVIYSTLFPFFLGVEPLLKLLDSDYPVIQDLALSALITCSQDGKLTALSALGIASKFLF